MINRNLQHPIKLVIGCCLCLSMAIFNKTFVFAVSQVTFEGGAENFVYSTSSPDNTDLFSGLKNAFPGDTLTDEIEVRNNTTEYDSVKIYLRAVPSENASSEMSDFLAQLTMKVYNGDELIFDSSPDKTATLTDNILLGDFRNGESTRLKIELSVPLSLSSEYMHQTGEVDWIFTAEGASSIAAPTPTPTSTIANTGVSTSDDAFSSQLVNLLIFFTLGFVAICGIIVIYVKITGE